MSDQDDLPPELGQVPREVLKHGKGRYKDVILVPQPSDSPNDPLNVRRVPAIGVFTSYENVTDRKYPQWPQWLVTTTSSQTR